MIQNYSIGNSTFIGFQRNGALVGVEPVAYRGIGIVSFSRYFEIEVGHDWLIDSIFVSAGNITAETGGLILIHRTTFNGNNINNLVWYRANNLPDWNATGVWTYNGTNLGYPVNRTSKLIFTNTDDLNLDIKRVVIVCKEFLPVGL